MRRGSHALSLPWQPSTVAGELQSPQQLPRPPLPSHQNTQAPCCFLRQAAHAPATEPLQGLLLGLELHPPSSCSSGSLLQCAHLSAFFPATHLVLQVLSPPSPPSLLYFPPQPSPSNALGVLIYLLHGLSQDRGQIRLPCFCK